MLIKMDRVNLPDRPAEAPQIDFGQDFEDFDPVRKIIYLKKLSSAMNHATDLIQKERNILLDQAVELKAVAKNADDAVAIQKAIVLKAITDHNIEKQQLIKRLQELESRIKAQDMVIEKFNKDN